jgi:hypothetical protein
LEEISNSYKILVWKPHGTKSLGRPRRRQGDNIKLKLEETGCGGSGLHTSGSGQNPVAESSEYGNKPSGPHKKFRDFLSS